MTLAHRMTVIAFLAFTFGLSSIKQVAKTDGPIEHGVLGVDVEMGTKGVDMAVNQVLCIMHDAVSL